MIRIACIGAHAHHLAPAHKKGYSIVVVAEHHKKIDYGDDVLQVNNIGDCADVLNTVRAYHTLKPIDGIITRFEPYVPLVAYLCEKLKLPSYAVHSALLSRNKIVMKEAWKKKHIATPPFVGIETYKDLAQAESILHYPYLLKPAYGAKSRFVMLVKNKKDAGDAYQYITKKIHESKNNLFKQFTGIPQYPLLKQDLIAETFVLGRQVTTTSFVDSSTVHHIALADVETAHDYGRESFYLVTRTTPSQLPISQQEIVKKFSAEMVRALGLLNTGVHPEILMTAQGPVALEVAARVGGYRAEMTFEACGIDLNEIAIELALGHAVNISSRWQRAATAVEIWPTEEGRIKKIHNLEKVQQMSAIKYLSLKKKSGDYYALPPEGEKPVMSFIATAATPQESLALARKIMAMLNIEIEKV